MKAENCSIARKVCLVVIDGWGLSVDGSHLDSIKDAKTPTMDELCANCPMTPLAAHGLHVGLADGLMGNSEVGHLNIGAGRVVYQDIVRIEMAIKNKEWHSNEHILAVADVCKKRNKPVHLMGLLSDGGVHSHIEHLKALLYIFKNIGVPQAYVHAITDGRDVGPKTAARYVNDLHEYMSSISYGKLVSMVGRYYAMDRDKRWERTEAAYKLYTGGNGTKYETFEQAITAQYNDGITDEFFTPSIFANFELIDSESAVVFFNFRSDRMRQIVGTFLGMTAVNNIRNNEQVLNPRPL